MDRPRVPRRPRPRPRLGRGPARPAGHGPAAGRSRRRRPGPRRRRHVPPGRHEARRGQPRQAAAHRRGAGRHRHQHDGRQRRLALGVRRERPGDRGGGGLTGRSRAGRGDVHAAARHLLAGAVGRQREHPREVGAALLGGARRLRAPHGQRQRLHPRRGARHPAEHLRVPHAVTRLERHRLQLPRRQVRPHLGGPVRRRRPARGRGAHAQLQRELLRHVGDRQLRDRPAERRDPAGLRRAVRLEAQPARRLGRLDPAVGGQPLLRGDQRPPRRRVDTLPRQVPLRADPADPAVRRGRAARVDRPRAGVQPGRLAVPRHPDAQEVRQAGLRPAHQRDDALRGAHLAGRRLDAVRRQPARARRDRRRQVRPARAHRCRRRDPGPSRRRQRRLRRTRRDLQQPRRTRPGHGRRRPRRRRARGPRRP